MLRLSRSSRCPLIRHAWKRGLEELPVNRVEDEGQHDGTPLINPTIIGRLLFQDVFIGPPKWFRVPGKGAPQRTYRHQAGGHEAQEDRCLRRFCQRGSGGPEAIQPWTPYWSVTT